MKSDAPRKAKADACRELAHIGTRASIGPLASLLCDEQLSHMARYGLEPIPDPAVDTALRDAAGKAKGRQLVGIIGSLGVRRDHNAVALLTRHLGDSDAEVVQASARSLGRIGTLDASKALESALPKTAEANRLAFYEGLCFRLLAGRARSRPAPRVRHLGNMEIQARRKILRADAIRLLRHHPHPGGQDFKRRHRQLEPLTFLK